MKTVSFSALGCRVNQYEVQAFREMFISRGWQIVKYGQKCDLCIINTCAVTKESERKCRHAISNASHFASDVVITGCYAELCRLEDNIPDNVFYCGGCSMRDILPDICENGILPYCVKDHYEEISIGNTGDLPNERYRAYVKIEDGCNGKCAYCVIPKLRGKSYKREENNIISEVKRLAESGVSEIILTGIEVSDYGTNSLCSLIRSVQKIDKIRRIRLGSLNPNTITQKFIQTILECSKLCRHIHLSAQSGCGRVLNSMKRPYSADKLKNAVHSLYNAITDIMLTADIISGFPGETETDFQETVDFIIDSRFMHVHAFPYSPRPFTEAAEYDNQISETIKKERNAYIIALSDKIKKEIAEDFFGKTVEILVEKNKAGISYGHTDGFMEAKVISSKAKVGDYITATVTGFDSTLICE